jgi:hypothetical protein
VFLPLYYALSVFSLTGSLEVFSLSNTLNYNITFKLCNALEVMLIIVTEPCLVCHDCQRANISSNPFLAGHIYNLSEPPVRALDKFSCLVRECI